MGLMGPHGGFCVLRLMGINGQDGRFGLCKGVCECEAVFVDGGALLAEDVVECAGAEELGGCSFEYGVGAEHPEAVGVEECAGDVVGGEEYGFALLSGEAAEESERLGGRCGVEIGGGFVEEDDGGFLCEGLGEVYALALSVAEGVDGSVGEGFGSGLGEGFADGAAVGGGVGAEEGGVGYAAHADGFSCGEGWGCGMGGEYYCDVAGALGGGEGGDGAGAVADGAAEGRLECGEGAQQGALAFTVGGDEGCHAGKERGGEVTADDGVAVACGEVGEAYGFANVRMCKCANVQMYNAFVRCGCNAWGHVSDVTLYTAFVLRFVFL